MTRPLALTLRPALPSEAPAMATMVRDLIEVGLPWRYTPRRMAALIADPEVVALVARDAHRIQGLAVMQFGDAHAHLVLMCVHAVRQRQGVGRCLHDWLLASARVAGMQRVEAELRADNPGALAFYRRLGYGETGLLSGYYANQVAARQIVLGLAAGPAPSA